MTAVLEHTYTPRGASRQLFTLKKPEVLIAGPAGTGKSRGCLEKLNALALRYPGMRGLITRKVAATLGGTTLKTWREDVVPEALGEGVLSYYGGSNEEPPQYRYLNGSVILINGMDKASKIMSSDFDVIYAGEATELTEDDWEVLTTRLRNGRMPYQQLFADCNPDSQYHWLNKRCGTGKTVMLHSRHEDNPRLFKDDGTMTPEGVEYIRKLDALTGVRYQRLRRGMWVAAEGVIYEEWNPEIHLIDAMPDGWESWPRYWSVDFGYTNPFVCQFWAEDPDGRLYLYREIYRTGRLVEEHARDILGLVTTEAGLWCEPTPVRIICDHDAEGRATFAKHIGRSTTPARKTVTDGIQAFASRLKPAKDGKPRLFIVKNCVVYRDRALVDANKPTCTEEEIPGYVWREGKEEPLKENDHGCDAGRYMVADRDLQGRVRGGWV